MLSIGLLQQGAWDTPLESMPLAAGYLRAVLAADRDLSAETDVRIHNFRGGVPLIRMAASLFAAPPPDVLACSVLGWNYRAFGALAETYKQLRPDGCVVFGGNHVAHQGARVLREHPAVDVVVDGEGEMTFRELVRVLLERTYPEGLSQVAGLTYRLPDGAVARTPDRVRLSDLDVVPSPFLTGALPMTDAAGRFRYDVALMETNRGCPYKCAFCYWGGAVGQRVRAFSRERLAAELDCFGFHQVPTVVLCDANFGLLAGDEEFVEDLIRTRERRGYPRAVETSWAKNKSDRFHRIVRDLRRHGFQSSFTLALQSLSDVALTGMRRRNMRVNEWENLADWLVREGLDCYAELIWGAPGETVESFLAGYDRLAARVSRIAVYPMLLLPNTTYAEQRARHGLVTVRGERDDFEYVLSNDEADLGEHLAMHRFIYFARLLGEHQFLRHVWAPARLVAGLRQSELIRSLAAWWEAADDPDVCAFLRDVPTIAESAAVSAGLRRMYATPAVDRAAADWWETAVVPRFPPAWRAFAAELYEFERLSRPRYVVPGDPPPDAWTVRTDRAGPVYVSAPVSFAHDVPAVLAALHRGEVAPPARRRTVLRFEAAVGFHAQCDNHETATHFVARPLAPSGRAPAGAATTGVDRP
ncbi:KedN5 family methylcobalamin-dependent radical SAM C-methyltransferase [Micromonospora sp. WMMD1128]|uniref:KedN5 family methylcobalamin-dependent radical SAM C-methyltransferase n=1 Tax=unclassified Micromonospora TaxID=2617518 RepID=UPI00248CDE20|nr:MULTISPECIES: KedN5 family methylcobalamin-dependent radical SAM C-methyltransferase [unclassified Micromonospora]WBB75794.1 KedN5 family methylcobalamin-dependent radical SAM C-methyltransferase [Micromonospora sp. WMMD1128]WFE36416.1 KedN5 family methylcobalamin-dependent radical SAM C-methyltransferase [Micromonospora sp. WMMD975]